MGGDVGGQGGWGAGKGWMHVVLEVWLRYDTDGDKGRGDLRDNNWKHRSFKEATAVHLMCFHTLGTEDRAGNGSGAVVGVADISRREIGMSEVEISRGAEREGEEKECWLHVDAGE